jgi:hypothetical protein
MIFVFEYVAVIHVAATKGTKNAVKTNHCEKSKRARIGPSTDRIAFRDELVFAIWDDSGGREEEVI